MIERKEGEKEESDKYGEEGERYMTRGGGGRSIELPGKGACIGNAESEQGTLHFECPGLSSPSG